MANPGEILIIVCLWAMVSRRIRMNDYKQLLITKNQGFKKSKTRRN